MRVMVAVGGGPSALYPLVPLAWAFRVAGHEVRLVGKPHAAENLMSTGLPVVTLGKPVKRTPRMSAEFATNFAYRHQWPADWPVHPDRLDNEQLGLLETFGRYTVAVADAMADDLVTFARQWRPDLIVHDSLALSVTAIPDVPTVRHTHNSHDVFRVEYRITDGEPLPEYVAMLRRFGVDPPTELPSYVDTVPPSLYIGAERPCVVMRWVPYNGSGVAPDGLTGPRRRPRVCVTWGVSGPKILGAAAADPYRDAVAAIAGGVEVLVLTTADQISSLGSPPDGVRYVETAPLNLVLPYCDVLVHHGGDGTVMAAANVGVPQLFITREPLADDFVRRVAAAGAGIHLRAQDLEEDPAASDKIRDAIEKLVSDPGYTEAAVYLRDDIERQPSPADVVPVLAEFAAG